MSFLTFTTHASLYCLLTWIDGCQKSMAAAQSLGSFDTRTRRSSATILPSVPGQAIPSRGRPLHAIV